MISTFACNDPATINTDLVDISLLDVFSEDDFDLTAWTATEDSVIAFQPSFFILNQYPFGIYQDPIFGTVNASLVAQYRVAQIPPVFLNATVDSVILEINLHETEPFYGDSTQAIGIEVREITEDLEFEIDYFSNQMTEVSPFPPIGTFQGVPNFRDSVRVPRLSLNELTFDTFPPQIRIPLSNSYGERIIFAGDDVLGSPSAFIEEFPGLEFRPTNLNDGMINFDLREFDSVLQNNLSGSTIVIYYTQNDVTDQFLVGVNSVISVKIDQQVHDISGTMLEEFVGDVALGDSLLFVQGLTGPNAVVNLGDLSDLEGTIVNGATLEVFGTALNGDEDLRPVPQQLVLRQEDIDGSLDFTRDFVSAQGAGDITIAGGTPEDMGNGIYKYTFQVASQLQDIIEGESPNELFIRVATKIEDFRRVVLFGADHSTYPIRLNVTFTKL